MANSTALLNTLRNAIDKKLVLKILARTAGEKDGALQRIIEPHLVGVNKTGNTILVAYQVSGGSVSGEAPQWRQYDLNHIDSCESQGTKFKEPRPGYNAGDKRMKQVLFALPPKQNFTK
jgi:predicted DNA-binding transcriptional regulator YafY